MDADSVDAVYEFCFKAHCNPVLIRPWADGNGRMARLAMNMPIL
ncbi:MAG: Fic family protein [Firmicutes bacterium]|nr:Fic family protein [Bacillota bacterium]